MAGGPLFRRKSPRRDLAEISLLVSAFHTANISANSTKTGVTFSDALAGVRLWLWLEAVLPQVGGGPAVEKLREPLREVLLTALAPAA
jgi:hypothetical protein